MINIPKNVGKIDRIIRAVVGVIFIAIGWGLLNNGWLGIVFNVLGAIALLTALTGKCYLYKLLKISTLTLGMKPPAQPSYVPPQNPEPPEQTPPPPSPSQTQEQ